MADENVPAPFWHVKRLDDMSKEEWESLCDGCARCCLNKLEDWDTGVIAWTDVACRLLDSKTCRCRNYENRKSIIADCIPLDAESVVALGWLPATCAYRLIAEGADLRWWHPLVSGDPETVHIAGISVRGRTTSEADIPVEAYENHIVTWPMEDEESGLSEEVG